MFPMASMMLANAAGGLAHRANAQTAGSTTCSKPAGVAEGDLVVIVASNNAGLTLSTSGGDAWARSQHDWSEFGYSSVIFAKRLTATDVANAWTFSGLAYASAVAFASGAANYAVDIGTPAEGTGDTLVLTAPSAVWGAEAVVVAVDRDPAVTPVAPAGMSKVMEAVQNTAWTVAVAFANQHGPNPATWTGLAGFLRQVGWMVRIGS